MKEADGDRDKLSCDTVIFLCSCPKLHWHKGIDWGMSPSTPRLDFQTLRWLRRTSHIPSYWCEFLSALFHNKLTHCLFCRWDKMDFLRFNGSLKSDVERAQDSKSNGPFSQDWWLQWDDNLTSFSLLTAVINLSTFFFLWLKVMKNSTIEFFFYLSKWECKKYICGNLPFTADDFQNLETWKDLFKVLEFWEMLNRETDRPRWLNYGYKKHGNIVTEMSSCLVVMIRMFFVFSGFKKKILTFKHSNIIFTRNIALFECLFLIFEDNSNVQYSCRN